MKVVNHVNQIVSVRVGKLMRRTKAGSVMQGPGFVSEFSIQSDLQSFLFCNVFFSNFNCFPQQRLCGGAKY